jgi:hypothetical protein
MAQVAVIIDRHSAAIHRHLPRMDGGKGFLSFGEGVGEGKGHGKSVDGSGVDGYWVPGVRCQGIGEIQSSEPGASAKFQFVRP